jgi:hypothetical protein
MRREKYLRIYFKKKRMIKIKIIIYKRESMYKSSKNISGFLILEKIAASNICPLLKVYISYVINLLWVTI